MRRSLGRGLLPRSPRRIRSGRALRFAARRAPQPAQVAAVPYPNAGGLRADRNPYADAAAPYKVDHLQASGKFPEPLLNTPKTITVLSKEVLDDKNATTLKQAVLSTAGVTLGTGEGGNAFGDRFFIRGFDARNDVFLDGVRDAGVSVRENFFTEQVEILRGPGSSFAGRGTTGGAINIVTKQATTERSFYNMDTSFGTDSTKRVMLDVNQVISPTLAVRAGGLFQDAGVAGRNYITDDRNGGSSRRSGRRSTPSSCTPTTSTPTCTACRISACRITGRGTGSTHQHRGRAVHRISASTATISTASSTATITASSRTSEPSAARSTSRRI